MGAFHSNGGSAAPHAEAMLVTSRGRVGSMGGETRKIAILSAVGVTAAMLLATSTNAGQALDNVKIQSCYDGDTCRTVDGERIRLACIDTPEIKGPRYREAVKARDYLRPIVENRWVRIRRITRDRYGRTVGELFVGAQNVQKRMVESGHAVVMPRYAKQYSWAI